MPRQEGEGNPILGIDPWDDTLTITPTPAAGNAAATTARSRAHFRILAPTSVGTMSHHLDRLVWGIAALAPRADLGLDAALMGLVFSANDWIVRRARSPAAWSSTSSVGSSPPSFR